MLRAVMTDGSSTPPEPDEHPSEGGVADALRSAVERTMRATAGSAATTRERAAELVDDVVRRGRDARDELARRGQEAGAGLARRGQEATGEVGRRLELLERRLAELEGRLDTESPTESRSSTETRSEVEGDQGSEAEPDSKAEG
jgi:polyhydroxyalkanoate synthesis regulator phasin